MLNRSSLRRLLLVVGLVAPAHAAWSIDDAPPKLEPVPDGAPVLGPAPIGETRRASDDEPVITIRRREGAQYKEYRVRGQLYAVKVTPDVGKPYWLIDRKGDGTMTRYDGPAGNLTVPQWLILEW